LDRAVRPLRIARSGFILTVEGWQAELETRRQPPAIHHGRNDPVISVEFARR
jgi:hypothetical protein